MAILVDDAFWAWRGRHWAHLVSDVSYAELHSFAERLGLERRWFQGDHYDVPSEYRQTAIDLGAEPVDSRHLVRRLRLSGLRLSAAERRRAAGQPAAARPEDRPVDNTPIHTDDLPATPQRDRTIPATAWVEAPAEVVNLGSDLGEPVVAYKRRIGRWLLWRAGPASRGHARYLAVAADDLAERYAFRLFPDGHGSGVGPDGVDYQRFRSWKEALRDTSP